MRAALFSICLILAACQYGNDLSVKDREVINCSGHSDCHNREVCRGIVSEEAACSTDGYLRVADEKVSTEPLDDEPNLFFFCHEGRRFFPFCVDEQITTCEDEDPCDGEQQCASPIGGGVADCVMPTDPPENCMTDADCTTGDCYVLFVVEQDSDSGHRESRCAECTSCLF